MHNKQELLEVKFVTPKSDLMLLTQLHLLELKKLEKKFSEPTTDATDAAIGASGHGRGAAVRQVTPAQNAPGVVASLVPRATSDSSNDLQFVNLRATREIGKLGADIYSAIAVMAEHLVKMRRNLGETVSNYNDFVGSLERNVLPKARRFADMGVDPGKKPVPHVGVVKADRSMPEHVRAWLAGAEMLFDKPPDPERLDAMLKKV